MTRDLSVQEAGPQDLAEVEALVKLAYEEFQRIFSRNGVVCLDGQHQQGRAFRNRDYINGGGIREDQGVVKFYPDAASSKLGHWPPGAAAMRILAVHPNDRGQGLGRLLVQECLDRARSLKIPKMYLYTGSFYEGSPSAVRTSRLSANS